VGERGKRPDFLAFAAGATGFAVIYNSFFLETPSFTSKHLTPGQSFFKASLFRHVF
jgi:hypothetical protein